MKILSRFVGLIAVLALLSGCSITKDSGNNNFTKYPQMLRGTNEGPAIVVGHHLVNGEVVQFTNSVSTAAMNHDMTLLYIKAMENIATKSQQPQQPGPVAGFIGRVWGPTVPGQQPVFGGGNGLPPVFNGQDPNGAMAGRSDGTGSWGGTPLGQTWGGTPPR